MPVLDRRTVLVGAGLGGSARSAEPGLIRAAAEASGFRFGAALSGKYLADPTLIDLAFRECAIITPENSLKPRIVFPSEGVVDFTATNALMTVLDAHGIPLRLHTLLFPHGRNLPPWLDAIGRADPEHGRAIVLDQARQVVTHVGSRAVSIDVLNEAIDPNSPLPGKLREGWLFQDDGMGFVRRLFEAVADAAPGVELAYNDWVLPYEDVGAAGDHQRRRDAIRAFLDAAAARGVPLTAIGIQSHLTHQWGRRVDGRGWKHLLRDIESHGWRIVISELSASDGSLGNRPIAERDAEMAQAVGDYLDVTLAAARSIRDVLTWGLIDTYFWENSLERLRERGRAVRALPYEDALAPKLMAVAIADALRRADPRR